MNSPELFRLRYVLYRLTASSCPNCGHPVFPEKGVCPYCRERLFKARFRHTDANIGLYVQAVLQTESSHPAAD